MNKPLLSRLVMCCFVAITTLVATSCGKGSTPPPVTPPALTVSGTYTVTSLRSYNDNFVGDTTTYSLPSSDYCVTAGVYTFASSAKFSTSNTVCTLPAGTGTYTIAGDSLHASIGSNILLKGKLVIHSSTYFELDENADNGYLLFFTKQ